MMLLESDWIFVKSVLIYYNISTNILPAVLSVNKLSKSISCIEKSLLEINGINSSSARTPEKYMENVKITRRTLRDLQTTATNKENLVGRSIIEKDPKSFSADRSDHRQKKQKVLMQNKSVQVGECIITAKDLISDEPSIDYWKKLAETRGESLNKYIEENEKLKENISTLQEENKVCKEMLEESRHLVEVLQELLEEKNDDDTVD